MNYSNKKDGSLELYISDDPDKFALITTQIEKLTGGRYKDKMDGPGQSYWELQIGNNLYTIYRDHYLGVSIFSKASDAKDVFSKIEAGLRL